MDEFYEVWASDNTSSGLKFDCCLSPNLERQGTGSTELEVYGAYKCLTCQADWQCFPTRPIADAWVHIKTYNSVADRPVPENMGDLCFNCRKPLTLSSTNVTGTGLVPGYDTDGKLVQYSTCAAVFCSPKCRNFHVPKVHQDNYKQKKFPSQEIAPEPEEEEDEE